MGWINREQICLNRRKVPIALPNKPQGTILAARREESIPLNLHYFNSAAVMQGRFFRPATLERGRPAGK
ncbi:MAG: hypothetical protein NZO58_00350 [Gemmataceae bacterium]|nr:hypothetical protein [Gemmataceae bacterium]